MAELGLPPLQASGPQSGLQSNEDYMPGTAPRLGAGSSAEQGDLGIDVQAWLDSLEVQAWLDAPEVDDPKPPEDRAYCWGGFLEGTFCTERVDKTQSCRKCYYCPAHKLAVQVPLARVRIAQEREALSASWTGRGSGAVKAKGFSTPYKRIAPPPPAHGGGSSSVGGSGDGGGGGDGIGKLFKAKKKKGPALLVTPRACGEADEQALIGGGCPASWFEGGCLVLAWDGHARDLQPRDEAAGSSGLAQTGGAGPSSAGEAGGGGGGGGSARQRSGCKRKEPAISNLPAKRRTQSSGDVGGDDGDGGGGSDSDCESPNAITPLALRPPDLSSVTTSALSSGGPQQQPSLSATFTVQDKDLLGLLAKCLRMANPAALEGMVQGKSGLRRLLHNPAPRTLGLSEEDAEGVLDWQRQTREALRPLSSSGASAEFEAAVRMMLDTYLCEAESINASGLSVEWRDSRFTLRLGGRLPSAPEERETLRARLENALRRLTGIEDLEVTIEGGSILVHCRCRTSEIPAAILALSGGTLCGYPVIAFDDGTPSPRVDSYEFDVRAPVQALQALRTLVEPAGALLGSEQPLAPEELGEESEEESEKEEPALRLPVADVFEIVKRFVQPGKHAQLDKLQRRYLRAELRGVADTDTLRQALTAVRELLSHNDESVETLKAELKAKGVDMPATVPSVELEARNHLARLLWRTTAAAAAATAAAAAAAPSLDVDLKLNEAPPAAEPSDKGPVPIAAAEKPGAPVGSSSFDTGASASDSFVFWTHKGGVGKTTLCFHSAITYAELNPKQAVVIIDLDEQANLSSMICTDLGNTFENAKRPSKSGIDTIKGLQQVYVDRKNAYSRTLCGVLMAADLNQFHVCRHQDVQANKALLRERAFLINPKTEGINDNMPENVHLLCGDRRIAGLAPHFVQKCAHPDALVAQHMGAIEAEWKTKHLLLKNWLDAIAEELVADPKYDGVTVFIDCNPSMNFFTELAMCTGKKLIVPVNADDFSLAAVESMFYSVYGMYRNGGNMTSHEEKMFFAVAQRPMTKVELPKVHAIIHNRSSIYREKQATCFAAMSKEQAKVMYQAYDDARHGSGGVAPGSHKHIFNHEQLLGAPEPQTVEQFADKFTGVMRDMGSTAVITVHSGIGLWLVKRNKKNIKASLPEAKISNSAVSSLADIIGPARDMRITLEPEAADGNPDNATDGNANNKVNGRGLYLIELLQGKKVGDEARKNLWLDSEKKERKKKKERQRKSPS